MTDVVMPDESGFDLLPRIKRVRPDLPVIVMSAQNTLLTAITATERGAYEYLPKPFDLNELISIARRAVAGPRRPPASSPDGANEIGLPLIGRSPAMQDVYRVMARLMGTDLTVLITGESGTGKELVARALHDYGKRKRGPFVAVNMAAIPRDLIESDLFGHEKGAFTGAAVRSIGKFEQSEGGTLFLDEIGDMPIEAQTRLLRVLQQGEYTAVGGRHVVRSDVRIVAATNRDLKQLARQGLFREDLYYRLNVVPLRLPPLRERLDDVADLVRHFLSQAAKSGLPQKTIDPDGLSRLRRHSWPGNVRELENLALRLAALYADDVISARILEAELNPTANTSTVEVADDNSLESMIERYLSRLFGSQAPGSLPADGLHERLLSELERPLVIAALSATKGNQIRAARLLGLNRNTLRKKIKSLEIHLVRSIR